MVGLEFLAPFGGATGDAEFVNIDDAASGETFPNFPSFDSANGPKSRIGKSKLQWL